MHKFLFNRYENEMRQNVGAQSIAPSDVPTSEKTRRPGADTPEGAIDCAPTRIAKHFSGCLALLFCLAAPLFAAPRDVTITLKSADGKPFTAAAELFVWDDKGIAVKKEKDNLWKLEPGIYSLYMHPAKDQKAPHKVWHGLGVKDDTTEWKLTVPPVASVQGRIVLADGKPAAKCYVSVQSGTWASYLTRPHGELTLGISPFPPTFAERDSWHGRGAQHAYSSTHTAADGSFTLPGLVPGNYALDVYDFHSKKHFTIPFAPALRIDAEKGEPTKIGDWKMPENGWDWLFDAKLQHNGAPAKFDGQGEMKIENGVLRLATGNDLTGVTWDDKTLPRENYEITLDARRTEGTDFFCGLTFPVADKPLSWILGGWGGTIVGLSNVNGSSAVENESTRTYEFEQNRWYRLRLRVSKAKIEAWIDGEKVIDMPTRDKEFSVRFSVESSLPLGIATWRTSGEVRDMRIRRLDAGEVTEIEKTVDQP